MQIHVELSKAKRIGIQLKGSEDEMERRSGKCNALSSAMTRISFTETKRGEHSSLDVTDSLDSRHNYYFF